MNGAITQFKGNLNQNSKKLHLDKYYTNDKLAQYVVNKTFEIIGRDSIDEIIEPSAGAGVFLKYLPQDTIAYDIEPENDKIISQNFLELNLEYKNKRLIIGNPPYGVKFNLARMFCNKSFGIAEYVSFILPISQLNNTQSIYKYDLIYSEDLGVEKYSDREIHCCLNIYKRPKDGTFNKKINYKNSKIIEIIEIREIVKNKNPNRNRELGDFSYDFAICAWGTAIGNKCSEGEYVKTFFIKIHDHTNYDYYKKLILNADWEKIYPMTATPNLLQWQVYKYVEENKLGSDKL